MSATTFKAFKYGTTMHTPDETGIDLESMFKEKPFSFDKRKVPDELLSLLNEIERNEKSWKSLYMGVWGFALKLKEQITEKWDEKIEWQLPASKKKYVIYTPKELYEYLTKKDDSIHIGQLITIFTLLEHFLFELNNYMLTHEMEGIFTIPKTSKNINSFSETKNMFDFLGKNKLISTQDMAELNLAKETRNSFIHTAGLIQEKWCAAYYPARKNTSKKYRPGDKVPLNLHELEDWHDLMVKIVANCTELFRR